MAGGVQLLDQDAYADVKSIEEAMVYFPERQEDGEWATMPVFTKRIPRTADFNIEGDELQL